MTKSQALYKIAYLRNLEEGQFVLTRAWDLVKLGGGQTRKTPCIMRGERGEKRKEKGTKGHRDIVMTKL